MAGAFDGDLHRAAFVRLVRKLTVEAVAAHRCDLANMEAEMRAHEAAVTDLLRAQPIRPVIKPQRSHT